jgi:hypothetical protein
VEDQLPIIGDVLDRCDQSGFQWEFRCKQCGNGYRSPHEHNVLGEGRGVLRMASSWFGGKVSEASWSLDAYNGGGGSGRKDRHYAKAVKAVLPSFRKCAECNRWVCAASCWNEPAERCTQCKPVDRAAAAAARGERITTRCTSCGAVGIGKFCSACGNERDAPQQCPKCSAKVTTPGAAFCSECGGKLGAVG